MAAVRPNRPAPAVRGSRYTWSWFGFGLPIRPDLARLIPASLVGVACALNLWVLQAETTVVQNLNDSAFHLAMIRWARYQIDRGQVPLDGWYPYLGTGFPLFHHYQSLPHIVTAYLSLFSSPAVLLNWILYLLLALWPVSVYFGARLLDWDRWTAALAAFVSPLLVSVSWYGFEHSSFTWRGLGMWSALWGMWLLPLAWGLSWRALTGKGSYAAASLAIAATIACHFLTGYLALLTLGVWFVVRPSVRRALRLAVVGAGALLIASWVIVPVLSDSKWALNSEYYRGTFWLNSYGATKVLHWLITGQLYDNGRFPIISLLAGVGLLVCLFRFFRDERARAVVGIWTLSLLLFFGTTTLGPLLRLLPGSEDLLFHRFIMGVHLSGILLAGVGGVWLVRRIGLMAEWFIPRFGRALALAGVVIVGFLALSPAWGQVAAYDQADSELIAAQQLSEQTDGADLAVLLDRVRTLGGGRVYAGSAANWGPTYAIGSVPVYTVLLNNLMDGFGFTLRVPSLLADTEVRFDESNPAQYDLFNLRYLILPVDRPPLIPATFLAAQGRHRLWQVDTSGYLEVVDTTGPPLVADRYNIGGQMAGFLASAALQQKQFPTVAFGGRPAAAPTLLPGSSVEGPAGSVQLESSFPVDGLFRAEVVANRPAAVLLKASYDPRWTVTVDGVMVQPEILAPGFVGATVSPGHHSLVFRYAPYPNYALLLGLGLLALLGLLFARRPLDRALDRLDQLVLPRTIRLRTLLTLRRPAIFHSNGSKGQPKALPAEGTPAPYVSLRSDPYRAHGLILRYCASARRLLEVGCSTGYLSEALTRQGCQVTGVEVDAAAAGEAQRFCQQVVVGDIETLDLSVLGDGYDVVLMADVLEHLRDPVATLRRLRPLIAPGGSVVISVPNVANWSMRLQLLAGRWQYTDRGILDRTHLRFFALRTILLALQEAGYRVRQLDASTPLPLNSPAFISRLAHAIGRLWPSFFAYQFILVAEPLPTSLPAVPHQTMSRRTTHQ